mmetsp:Transcript_9920/g.20850  ORF Transcript_9920/g.20850 Transcript_9920/m.20850 type:complete len:312 (+) Transcript_9920:40-975(+)
MAFVGGVGGIEVLKRYEVVCCPRRVRLGRCGRVSEHAHGLVKFDLRRRRWRCVSVSAVLVKENDCDCSTGSYGCGSSVRRKSSKWGGVKTQTQGSAAVKSTTRGVKGGARVRDGKKKNMKSIATTTRALKTKKKSTAAMIEMVAVSKGSTAPNASKHVLGSKSSSQVSTRAKSGNTVKVASTAAAAAAPLRGAGRRCSRCGMLGHNSRSCKMEYFTTPKLASARRLQNNANPCARCGGAGVVSCTVCDGCSRLTQVAASAQNASNMPAPPTAEIMSLSHLSYVYNGEGRSEICFKCGGSSLIVCPRCRGLA